MNVLPVTKSNSNNVNFKNLYFHNNAKEVITKGDKTLLGKVAKIEKKLENIKNIDLHASVDSSNELSFYWTHGEKQTRFMDFQSSPFIKLTLHKYHPDNKAVLEIINNISGEQTANAYRSLIARDKTPVDKLDSAADITIDIANK